MKTIVEKSGKYYCVNYFNEYEQCWRYVPNSWGRYKFFAKRLAKKISIEGLPKNTNDMVPIAMFENGEEK